VARRFRDRDALAAARAALSGAVALEAAEQVGGAQ
jgi:hypothetical protein